MSFDALDATLPPALQEVVTYQEPAPKQESKGETIMPEAITANANSALTPEQVRAIASEAVKQADAEKAVAAQLQKLTDEGAKFKADLDKEIKAGVEKAGDLATASDKIAKLEADLATANQKAVESEKTSKALAAELNKIKAERVIASRTKTLTDARLGTGTASASNWLRGDNSWAAPTKSDVGLGNLTNDLQLRARSKTTS